jgi:hypothetical protein
MFDWSVRASRMATEFPPHRACVHHECTSLAALLHETATPCRLRIHLRAHTVRRRTIPLDKYLCTLYSSTYTSFTMAPSLPCECARENQHVIYGSELIVVTDAADVESPLKPDELQVLRAQYEKEGEYVGLQTKFNYAWVCPSQSHCAIPTTPSLDIHHTTCSLHF